MVVVGGWVKTGVWIEQPEGGRVLATSKLWRNVTLSVLLSYKLTGIGHILVQAHFGVE